VSLHHINGHDLILLGRGFLALVDSDDLVTSEAIPGTMWTTMRPRTRGTSESAMMFLPKHRSAWQLPSVTFKPVEGYVRYCGWYLRHEDPGRCPMMIGKTYVVASPGDTVSIRYRDAFEDLASDSS